MLKASFVLPVKNSEAFILKTIQSLLNQTYANIEVIVVDDHSTDQSPKILQRLASKDKRIFYLNLKKGEGPAAARNMGTKLATGQVILPTDADDPNYPERAKVSVEMLEKHKADIFYGNLMRFYVDSNKKELRHYQPYDAQLLDNINYIAHSGASAYYKYVFGKVRGYDENIIIGEDYDFWLKAQECGFKFCSENIPLAQYTMHKNQITTHDDKAKIVNRQKWNRIIRSKHSLYNINIDYVKKHCTPEVYDFYINKNYKIWFGKESIPQPDD